jgi:alpha-glucosidase
MEDGAMNYFGFTHPLRAWLAGNELGGVKARLSTRSFEGALRRAVAAIPYANQLAQFNLLGSHDTPRILTELQGDAALMQLAATLLFTWPGVPCIYYGDETGMQGGADPDCRRCFDWDRSHWNHALFEHFKQLAQTRSQRAEWREGAVLTLAVGDEWMAFARITEQAISVVVVNRGPAVKVTVPLHGLPWLPAAWRTLIGPAVKATHDTLTAQLPAAGQAVWMSA